MPRIPALMPVRCAGSLLEPGEESRRPQPAVWPYQLALAVLLATAGLAAAEPGLRPDDRIAIIGDSITERRGYSRMIEVYLRASAGIAGLDVLQAGWSSESAGEFRDRGVRTLRWYRPTVATTAYGMNDAAYREFVPVLAERYRDATAGSIALLRGLGARTIVVASPGAVDPATWRHPLGADTYNAVLARFVPYAQQAAEASGAVFVDMHRPLQAAMAGAKTVFGPAYHVCGADGVHPEANGHLIMAAAFLTALGCDGDLARIELAADGTATASPGHTVVAAAPGMVEVDSARWPFILHGEPASPFGTRSIAAHCDFVQRLDRFILAMPSCPWPQARIAWGNVSATVPGDRLRAGVNLIEVFTSTPFDAAVAELARAVMAKQGFEIDMVKWLLGVGGRATVGDPESEARLDSLVARLAVVRQDKVAAVQAQVKPIRHRIVVTAP